MKKLDISGKGFFAPDLIGNQLGDFLKEGPKQPFGPLSNHLPLKIVSFLGEAENSHF